MIVPDLAHFRKQSGVKLIGAVESMKKNLFDPIKVLVVVASRLFLPITFRGRVFKDLIVGQEKEKSKCIRIFLHCQTRVNSLNSFVLMKTILNEGSASSYVEALVMG